jgi:hypothetical protein
MVTCRSCMASSRALWTLAGARLISSARTRLAKIGPRWARELAGLRLEDHRADDVAGQQVGRELDALELDAQAVPRDLTRSVLARPGMPSSRTWPLASRATSRRSTTASWPMTALADFIAEFLGPGGTVDHPTAGQDRRTKAADGGRQTSPVRYQGETRANPGRRRLRSRHGEKTKGRYAHS